MAEPVDSSVMFLSEPCADCPWKGKMICNERGRRGFKCQLALNDLFEADDEIVSNENDEDDPGNAIASDLFHMREHLKQEEGEA